MKRENLVKLLAIEANFGRLLRAFDAFGYALDDRLEILEIVLDSLGYDETKHGEKEWFNHKFIHDVICGPPDTADTTENYLNDIIKKMYATD